jgi:hypothetical protein
MTQRLETPAIIALHNPRIQSSAPFTKLNLSSTAIASARKNPFRIFFFWRICEVENESLFQPPKSAIDCSQFPKKLTSIWCQIHAESEEEEDARLRN